MSDCLLYHIMYVVCKNLVVSWVSLTSISWFEDSYIQILYITYLADMVFNKYRVTPLYRLHVVRAAEHFLIGTTPSYLWELLHPLSSTLVGCVYGLQLSVSTVCPRHEPHFFWNEVLSQSALSSGMLLSLDPVCTIYQLLILWPSWNNIKLASVLIWSNRRLLSYTSEEALYEYSVTSHTCRSMFLFLLSLL